MNLENRTKNKAIEKWIGMLFICAIFSCGGSAKRSHDLLHDIDAYNEGIRWRKLPQAAVRIPVQERSAFLDEREQLEEELRIDEFEMTRLKINGETQESADVQIRWTWHMDRDGIVKHTTSKQKWKRFGERWMMMKESHVRGQLMPGIPEVLDLEEEKEEEEELQEKEKKEGQGSIGELDQNEILGFPNVASKVRQARKYVARALYQKSSLQQ